MRDGMPAKRARASNPHGSVHWGQVLVGLILTVFPAFGAFAVDLGRLDLSRIYRLDSIRFDGNQKFSDSDLEAVLAIHTRPFYALWQKRPQFDPATFTTDLEQLKLFYEAHGYYDAHFDYDLALHDDLVTARITIKEGQPVKVDTVSVEMVKPGPPPQELQPDLTLPLKPGDIFTQLDYQASEQNLLTLYRQNGFANPEVKRSAVVKTGPHLAHIWYRVLPNERGVFGRTTVTGTHGVDPRIVLRELAYRAGQPFDIRKIEQSRSNLLGLNLFAAVDFNIGDSSGHPHVVPITIAVQEKPPHSLNLALGYNTETLLNAQLGWNDYNFLGGGRQLTINGTYSQIIAALDLKLLQPHFFSPDARGIIEGALAQESYQTYLLNATRFDPHLDYSFTPSLTGSLGYRLEYLKFNHVSASAIRAIGGFRRAGILSGLNGSLVFNNTTDVLNPQNGEILSVSGDFVDRSMGGDYSYWRIQGEARKYQPLGGKTILATRLKLGLEDTFRNNVGDVPLSERFYLGGEGSVRGYGLRRIGRLSLSNDPLGGLGMVEMSAELRHPLLWKLSGAVFVDCGSVSTHSLDIPVDSLQCGFGPAIMLDTPVGPARVDIGFPTKPARKDQNFQLYFSIGQFF